MSRGTVRSPQVRADLAALDRSRHGLDVPGGDDLFETSRTHARMNGSAPVAVARVDILGPVQRDLFLFRRTATNPRTLHEDALDDARQAGGSVAVAAQREEETQARE